MKGRSGNNPEIISRNDLLPLRKRSRNLYLSRRDLARVRKSMNEPPLRGLWEGFKSETMARIGEAIPGFPAGEGGSPEGVIAFYDVFRKCLEDVLHGSFIYLIDGTPEMPPFVRERIRTVLSWETWVHPAHYPKTVDLVSSHIARTLALACDWLGESLPSVEREDVADALNHRLFEQYITGMLEETGWWANECTTNWCAVVNGGIGSSLVHFIDDNSLLADILNEIIKRLAIYLKGFDPDGGWIEGVSYWNYGLTWYLYFAEAVEKATSGRVNPAQVEQVKKAGDFPLHSFLPPDRIVNFCDSYSNLQPGFAVSLMKLAHEFGSRQLRDLGDRAVSQMTRVDSPYAFIWNSLPVEPEEDRSEPTAKRFRKIEWGILRSSWQDDATVLAAKAGYANPWEHTHLDAGTFLLHSHGKTLIADLGRGSYSVDYFSHKRWGFTHANTQGHNTYIIDGKNQLPMKEHNGKITHFRNTRAFKYVRMDISGCYDTADVSMLVRHFVMLGGRLCLILDEVNAAERKRVEFRCHYDGHAKLNGEGQVSLRNGNAGLAVLVDSTCEFKMKKGRHGGAMFSDYGGVSSTGEIGKYLSVLAHGTGKAEMILSVMLPYAPEEEARPSVSITRFSAGQRGVRVGLACGDRKLQLLWTRRSGKNVLDSIL